MKIFKRFTNPVFIILIGLATTSCGGSGSSDDDDDENILVPLSNAALLPVARCTALHVNALARLIERTQELYDVINGAPLPATITETTPLVAYTFLIDLEPDNITDVTVDVDVVSGGTNIIDGIQPGESITLNLMFQGDILGNLSLQFDGPNPFLTLSGPVDLNDGGTCSINSAFISPAWEAGDTSSTIVGLVFSSIEGLDTYNGMLSKGSLEDIITATGQLVVGGNPPENIGFVIDLDTFGVFEN